MVIFDLKTYAVLGKIKAAEDADGIIYDAHSDKVLLVCGDAGVLIPIAANVDPATGSADPAIDLGGKPEFMAADGEGKVFINLEDKDQVIPRPMRSSCRPRNSAARTKKDFPRLNSEPS